MSKMLASLDRLEELSVHSDRDNSGSGGGSFSNSLSNSKSASQNDSSGYDNSATGTSGGSEIDVMAKKAGRTVMYLKFLVLFILLAATAIVGAAVYLTTDNGEQAAFEQSFDDNAVKVFDTFKFNVERKLGALDKFSVEVTSLAVDSGASWPNFTMPDFEYRAPATKALADVGSVVFLPFVEDSARAGWEAYSVENAAWIQDSQDFMAARNHRELVSPNFDNGFSDQIYVLRDGEPYVNERSGPYYPIWQHYPVIPQLVNYNLLWNEQFHDDIQAIGQSQDAVIGAPWDLQKEDDAFVQLLAPWLGDFDLEASDLLSIMFYPIFDGLSEGHQKVGMLASLISWKDLFQNILSPQVTGMIAILSNDCGESYTYKIVGEDSFLVGEGDQHDRKFDSMVRRQTFQELFNEQEQDIRRYSHAVLDEEYCPYTMSVYPSDQLKDDYVTNDALYFTIGVVAVFGLTIIAFLAYDFIVSKRQHQVMKRAVQSRAIVSSLFPAAVRDRLFRSDDSAGSKAKDNKVFKRDQAKSKLRNFLTDSVANKEQHPVQDAKPIADLFPHTTVMFADIAGFTRWSSERDPTHVFTLLQTVYHSFDRIAKKRKVFKVETIGDCYVAVTGLPDPQLDHALRMSKFANECKQKFTEVVSMLKESLGEDTADLAMRFGLHSGPVTAGVLRGEKSRFQLFGNTVNTAAKMENTGQRNKIQISSETADLITAAGKGHWIFLRVDDIAERGGIQTYWVEPQSSAQEAKHNNAMPTRMTAKVGSSDNCDRLIDWNVDLLKNLLKRIVAYRIDMGIKKETDANFIEESTGAIVRDEVAYSISLPRFDETIAKTKPESIKLGREVEEQLHSFVSLIAGLYHDNPFHNFKHASNVCTNANKMMKSIMDQDIYARTRDPLTHFAVVFSALIHDADHPGVPNPVLMKEKPRLAALYKKKSCAEQNSVDMAWNLLMDPEFEKLQDTIFYTKEEFARFRQIVVQIVMSTDIFDKELNGDREVRWQRAFGDESKQGDISAEELANLRATVSIECAMQLSDVMHTTQHFHSYCRWNERLFEEMYRAYDMGRTKKDPSTDWYQGEIWFFDNCVIPMAERIRASGVFGAQGEDCFRNAMDNKKEWAIRGGELLVGSIEKVLKDKKETETSGTAAQQEEKKDENKDQVAEESEKKKSTDADKHMIEWNVDLFKRLLRQILANRMGQGKNSKDDLSEISNAMKEGSVVRDELSRIIKFPFFDKEACRLKVDPEAIELSDEVQTQLRDYILFIASMYKDHPFHNFKHASNVATTTNKFLQRIKDDTLEMQVFEPLTQFAIIFSALCHDVDHPGVPNALLVAESNPLAIAYKNRSVAEQNSVDLAWTSLMGSEYKDLQSAIFGSQDEMDRFRKLVVNCVLATDLFDQELIEDRLLRWKQAFDAQWRDESLSVEQQENLRATIVMEHVLMASDIGHTIQHWHSYKRWNERLYFEMYEAFQDKRLETDPTPTWYSEEIKFFDTVVIPMANRLKDSGMFGMAGDDAIRCAQSNRKDWVVNGGAVVEGLKKRYKEYKAGNIR